MKLQKCICHSHGDFLVPGGAGLTIQNVTNIIIEGVHIHNIISTGPARVMSSVTHVGERGVADGDAISIYAASNIWIDHCYLSNAADGLIDAILGSTSITISNNYFANHDKVGSFLTNFNALPLALNCFTYLETAI